MASLRFLGGVGSQQPVVLWAIVTMGALVAASCGAAQGSTLSVEVPDGPVVEQWSVAEGDRIASSYLVVTSPEPGDRLVAASSPVALRVSIHATADSGAMSGVGSLDLPAGEPVEMLPGRRHLMLEGLDLPLVPGDRVPIELVFERAGPVSGEVPVVSLVDVLDIYSGG